MKNVVKITLGLLLTASVSAGVSYLTVQRAQSFAKMHSEEMHTPSVPKHYQVLKPILR